MNRIVEIGVDVQIGPDGSFWASTALMELQGPETSNGKEGRGWENSCLVTTMPLGPRQWSAMQLLISRDDLSRDSPA